MVAERPVIALVGDVILCPECGAEIAVFTMTDGERKVLENVREIIADVAEGAETPGGVEHLGDFRRLVGKWERWLGKEFAEDLFVTHETATEQDVRRWVGNAARDAVRGVRRELLALLDQGSDGVWGLSREDVDRICPETRR